MKISTILHKAAEIAETDIAKRNMPIMMSYCLGKAVKELACDNETYPFVIERYLVNIGLWIMYPHNPPQNISYKPLALGFAAYLAESEGL